MRNTKVICFSPAKSFSIGTTLVLIMLVLVAATTSARAQNVSVPGNASGCFGNGDAGCVPLVAALTVSGPGTITVTYVSGTVNWGGGDAGPNGVPVCFPTWQQPLQEAQGVSRECIKNAAALIGVFVPQSRTSRKGFNALDGTKNITLFGILPGNLFFIGTSKTFSVSEAGTLFLGINDSGVNDNSGSFNVTVTGP